MDLRVLLIRFKPLFQLVLSSVYCT